MELLLESLEKLHPFGRKKMLCNSSPRKQSPWGSWEEAKMKRQLLEEEGREEYKSKEGLVSNKVLDEQEQIEVYIDEVRKAHLIFKRNESAIEIVAQMGIQLTMLLLSRDRVA